DRVLAQRIGNVGELRGVVGEHRVQLDRLVGGDLVLERAQERARARPVARAVQRHAEEVARAHLERIVLVRRRGGHRLEELARLLAFAEPDGGARLAQTRRRGERIVRVALEEAGEARLGVLEIADLETRARLAVRVIGLGVGRRADRLGARIEARRAAGEQDQRRRRRPQSLADSETHRHCTATLANAHLPGKRGDMANTHDAHLEAAWKLLESGDFAGARKQAEDAVALDDDSADAHTILGAVAAAEGDVERALASLDRAMDLDPEAFDPALLAAETMAGAGQLEDALEACDVALDRAEEEDEYLDA